MELEAYLRSQIEKTEEANKTLREEFEREPIGDGRILYRVEHNRGLLTAYWQIIGLLGALDD